MKHSWTLGILTDTCKNCGIERKIVARYKDTTDPIKFKLGPQRVYLLNGIWVNKAPDCNQIKQLKTKLI